MVKRQALFRARFPDQILEMLPAFTGTAPWRAWLFLLPFIAGVIAKLMHSDLWFGDYQAVACAGQKVLNGAPVYDLNLACAGMKPSVFVYIAPVAQFAAWCQAVVGEPVFFLVYLVLFVAGLSTLIVLPVMAPGLSGSWNLRMPFAVLWSGSAVMWGNIAVLLHAAILGAALLVETVPLAFVAVVVIAAWVKPVFLAYLAVILLADMSIRRRAGLAACGLIAGVAPTLAFTLTGGAMAEQWLSVLSHFVYDTTPGYGFYGWLDLIGINSHTPFVTTAWLVYAMTLSAYGFTLAEGLRLGSRERMWLGLSLAVLIIPRLLANDLFLVGPGLVAVARRTADWIVHQKRTGPLERVALMRAPEMVAALCGLALIGGLTGLGDYTTALTLLGFSACLIWLGKTVLRFHAVEIFTPVMLRFLTSVRVRT